MRGGDYSFHFSVDKANHGLEVRLNTALHCGEFG